MTRALAMEARCFWPPESSCGCRLDEIRQFEGFQHLLNMAVAIEPPWTRRRRRLDRKIKVLTHRHMGEQRMILENVSTSPLLRRKMHSRGCIEKELVLHQNAAFVGMSETGKAIERQRFPGAARAE